jgi:hypothetical protein
VAEANLAKQIADLKHLVEFWKDGYTKIENEQKETMAKFVQQSSELVGARDSLASALRLVGRLKIERDGAIRRLLVMLDHTAGRNGSLAKSELFCSTCMNPYNCPAREAREFLKPFLPTEEPRAEVAAL